MSRICPLSSLVKELLFHFENIFIFRLNYMKLIEFYVYLELGLLFLINNN